MSHAAAPPVVDYSTPRAEGSTLTQTWGLLIDAYRDLHARRLFWITLVLSMLVPAVFLFVGINERGITIFAKEIPGAWNTNIIPKADFYRYLVVAGAIPMWLGFFAAVLALISVGGIFPEMLTGGSIDLYLSKPIGRVRLFVTKYLFALLFVGLQVLGFCVVAFVVIGVRGDTWDARLFLAVPLVMLFFSYLFCFCVLLGIVTRSTLAAILLTALFWGLLFAVDAADEILVAVATAAEQRVTALQRLVRSNEDLIARNAALPQDKRSDLSQFEFQRDRQKENLTEAEQDAERLRWWQELVVAVKTPLPKPNETVELMQRWMVDPTPFYAAEDEQRARRAQRRAERGIPPATRPAENLGTYMHSNQTEREVASTMHGRSVGWVVATSVGFEVVILALAAWIFSRRDF